jgi:hypothetical protein
VIEQPVFVEMLTDEELSVVARRGAMPVMPFLSDLPVHEADVARRSAYRSLIARGIVDPPTPAAVAEATARRDGSVELMVRQDVRSAVALREAAQLIVAVARTTAVTQDYWYAHLVDDVVLLEEVSRDGMHRFALARAEQLTELAAGATVHPEAGDAAGEPVPVTAAAGDPTPPDDILERLGAAFLRTDVIVRRPGDDQPPRFAVFSGPDGCWVVDADTAEAAPVTAEAARARLGAAVEAVRAEAVTLGD